MRLNKILNRIGQKYPNMLGIIKKEIANLSSNKIVQINSTKSLLSALVDNTVLPAEDAVFEHAALAYKYGQFKLGNEYQSWYLQTIMAGLLVKQTDAPKALLAMHDFYVSRERMMFYNGCIYRIIWENVGKKPDYVQ